jgi:hypothetical protein
MERPSAVTTTSPGFRPAFSAGEPSSGAMITRWQSGPNGLQSLVLPAESTAPISAPMPSNVPEMESMVPRKSYGLRYEEYGSPTDSTMPRIAPSTSVVRSTGPSG